MTHALRRWRNAITYGWSHSKQAANDSKINRLRIYADMLSCYHKYGIYTNRYLEEGFHLLDSEQRQILGEKIKIDSRQRCQYIDSYYAERSFLSKYCSQNFNTPVLEQKRNRAFASRYNAGKGFYVQHNVYIYREHMLDGQISIGKNVCIPTGCRIDYSGGLSIGDNVHFSADVYIDTHEHKYFRYVDGKPKQASEVIKKPLVIQDSVHIGQGAKILNSCNLIGRFAQIGAGAIVRCDIPPYAIVLGNPAKIVGFVLPPQASVHIEAAYPEADRYNPDHLASDYQSHFLSRLTDIQSFLSLHP